MPPKRSKNNVDVDDEGEGDGEEDEVKRIRIVKSNRSMEKRQVCQESSRQVQASEV